MRSPSLLIAFVLVPHLFAQQRGGQEPGPERGAPRGGEPRGGDQRGGEPRGRGRGGPGGMARMLPVMSALDTDSDGALSVEEIAAASTALLTLDEDKDGTLSEAELMPAFGPGGPGGFGGPGGPGGFGGPGGGGPLGPRKSPGEMDASDGLPRIPDRAAFEQLSYKGQEVMVDEHLAGLEFVKFQLERADTDAPELYFMNTDTHRAHPMFMRVMGLPMGDRGTMRGVIVYRPLLSAPDGAPGLYTFEFEPNDSYSFDRIALAFRVLGEHSELLRGRLAYYPIQRNRQVYDRERDLYTAAQLPVFLAEDEFVGVAYLPLHRAEGFGRLRLLLPGEQPGPRDVVVCPTLPNEMPRVAGILTGVRQTPLSHVNLRAIQDDVPNAFVKGVDVDPRVTALLGKQVFLAVRPEGYELREASAEEVAAHFAALRPKAPIVPERDLSVTKIRPLSELAFADWRSVGVKAANLATLRTFELPEGLVPDGHAIPFAFYETFMQANGLDVAARELSADPRWTSDSEWRTEALEELQKRIRKADMPAALAAALEELRAAYPAGTSLRLRSSTNNEDLEGFSGAGLYDSFTHKPDEGPLAKTVKQVFASAWNFRAVEEREFFRIDHFTTAMGILVHPNFKGETLNGVAVTEDTVYGTTEQYGRTYYVNAQVGEDLVTNPSDGAIPEELLLDPRRAQYDVVLGRSSLVADEALVLSLEHRNELRAHLTKIHDGFRRLYGKSASDPFAIEVEFKVTAEGRLSIKQARPWVR